MKHRFRPGRCALMLLAGACGLEVRGASPPCLPFEGELFIRHRPESCRHGFPFLDLADGKRFEGRGRVALDEPPLEPPPAVRTGYALPCRLRWTCQPGAMAQLLSLRHGEAVVRKQVTGRDSLTVSFRAPVRDGMVETLLPKDGSVDVWSSRLQRLQVDVRGVFPFAGDLFAEGEHKDGPGTSARFRGAFAMARIPVRSHWAPVRWDLLVTDPLAHVLRRVSPEGNVSTFCGNPDQPSHRDSPGLAARLGSVFCGQPAALPGFNRPSHLTVRKFPGIHDLEILVSDSGNHVVRRVSPDGQVDTLAGTPGQPGHYDTDQPREALFNDPQGITADAEGNLYVADRGNQVIRCIDRSGQVTTLAGSPGQAGTADGLRGSARFTDLKGLACQSDRNQGGVLYAVDGHAVRAVSFPEGVVATVLGQVEVPGFRDVPPGEPDSMALRQPCLRGPTGLLWHQDRLYLADTGNHAIRKADLDQGSLVTVVGDANEAGTRWGLLRDGIPGPLGPGFAALESPTALAGGPQGPGVSMVVCAGRGLVAVHDRAEVRDTLTLTEVECRPENRIGSRALMVVFRALTFDPQQRGTARAIHYSVDFLDPDGALATRREGRATSSGLVMVQGAFTKAGRGRVVIRCVTGEGVSAGTQTVVPVG